MIERIKHELPYMKHDLSLQASTVLVARDDSRISLVIIR
jgi:hypothetical protein